MLQTRNKKSTKKATKKALKKTTKHQYRKPTKSTQKFAIIVYKNLTKKQQK